MNWFKEFAPRNSSRICILKWYLYKFMAHANLPYSMRAILWNRIHILLWFWERRNYEPQICESCCSSYNSIFTVCSVTLQHCLKIHTCSTVCVLVWHGSTVIASLMWHYITVYIKNWVFTYKITEHCLEN